MSVQDHSSVAVALDCHQACDQPAREYLSFLECSQGVTRGTVRKRRHTVGAFIRRPLKHRVDPEQLAWLHLRWQRDQQMHVIRYFMLPADVPDQIPHPRRDPARTR